MIPWRRERLPTPIFWPGELNGQRSLVSYTVYGVAKNQTQLSDFHFHFQEIVKCWVGRSLNTSSKAPACMLNCFSCIPLCVTLWTAACQAPLSIGSSRQEYWSGLPFLSLGTFLILSSISESPALQDRFLPTGPPGKSPYRHFYIIIL